MWNVQNLIFLSLKRKRYGLLQYSLSLFRMHPSLREKEFILRHELSQLEIQA
jgi:hypothetical protein